MVLILFVQVLKKVLKSLKFELKYPGGTLIECYSVVLHRLNTEIMCSVCDRVNSNSSSGSVRSLICRGRCWPTLITLK